MTSRKRFRQSGGGILSTHDHQDLGMSLCALGGVGAAHYFNTRNPEPDELRGRRDDFYKESISPWDVEKGAPTFVTELQTGAASARRH